jgi:hypothetical protein
MPRHRDPGDSGVPPFYTGISNTMAIGASSHPRRAAVLVILAAALSWHVWVPALIVVVFLAWVAIHRRFEGPHGDRLARRWHQVWPPPAALTAVVALAGAVAYAASTASLEVKTLPIALNVLAIGVIAWGALFARSVPIPSPRRRYP